MSLLYIFIFFTLLYFLLNTYTKSLSFSIIINEPGFLFIISSVKAPLPGPISIILLFSIFTKLIIFLIMFFYLLKNFGQVIFWHKFISQIYLYNLYN